LAPAEYLQQKQQLIADLTISDRRSCGTDTAAWPKYGLLSAVNINNSSSKWLHSQISALTRQYDHTHRSQKICLHLNIHGWKGLCTQLV